MYSNLFRILSVISIASFISCLKGPSFLKQAGDSVEKNVASSVDGDGVTTGKFGANITSVQTLEAGGELAGAASIMIPVGGFSEVPLASAGIDPLWTTYNDCAADPKNCTTGANEPYRDFDNQPYCTKGTAARFDGSNFGAGIVLGFGGTGPENSFDAIAAGIAGFSFDITGVSPAAVLVEMQSAKLTPDVLAWGHYGDATLGKRTAVTFDELTTYPDSTPVDPHTLTLVSFSVVAGPAAIPFDYCIANVKMLKR